MPLTTQTPTHASAIPSIRLISATPSATGLSSSEASNTSFPCPVPPLPTGNGSFDNSWSMTSIPSSIIPKEGRKKLVPKKSKISLLPSSSSSSQSNSKKGDFSDVMRRVGVPGSTRGGFEIYVDAAEDPEMGDVVLIKKKKSRVGLDGMSWGGSAGVMGEVTNVPKQTQSVKGKEQEGKKSGEKGIEGGKMKEKGKGIEGGLKVKTDEAKWWSIGRGRKDSKDKSKENKLKGEEEHKSSIRGIFGQRSKTPEPLRLSSDTDAPKDNRQRFNSLDSGILLNTPINMGPTPVGLPPPSSRDRDEGEGVKGGSTPAAVLLGKPTAAAPRMQRSGSTPTSVLLASSKSDGPAPSPTTFARSNSASATPTAGGFLAPPGLNLTGGKGEQGSIALRAIKSVRSLARMSSWAQIKPSSSVSSSLSPSPGDDEEEGKVEVKDDKKKAKKSKKDKEGTVKEKKPKKEKKENGAEEGTVRKKKKKDGTVKKKLPEEGKKEAGTLRLSTSSFEAGALTSSPAPKGLSSSTSPTNLAPPQTLGKKKHSILGLGLPSSMRLPNMRSGSTASSILVPSNANSVSGTAATVSGSRLSVESAFKFGRDRAGSTLSTNSSLRPMSVASSGSRNSSSGCSAGSGGSGAASIRWDEEGLNSVKEQRRRERREKREQERKEGRESREEERMLGRKRVGISDVFPEVAEGVRRASGELGGVPCVEEMEERVVRREVERRESAGSGTVGRKSVYPQHPILMIEEATNDGHSFVDGSLHDFSEGEGEEGEKEGEREGEDREKGKETPVKKARRRPMSEQLLGKSRPVPVYEGEDGVLSILETATNDLAQLINHLDLEATPATPDITPARPAPISLEELLAGTAKITIQDSPTKSLSVQRLRERGSGSLGRGLRDSTASISSLRPYAAAQSHPAQLKKSNSKANLIGQQIAPWSVLSRELSPVKEKEIKKKGSSPPFDKPLPPTPATLGKNFKPGHKRTMTPAPEPEPELVFHPLPVPGARRRAAPPKLDFSPQEKEEQGTVRAPMSFVFGGSQASSRAGSKGSQSDFSMGTPTGSVFSRPEGQRKRSSLAPLEIKKSSRASTGSMAGGGIPIPPETRKFIGMGGTLGGSDVSAFNVEVDASDPDSDVPEELRFILSGSDKDDTLSYRDAIPEDSPVEEAAPISEFPPQLDMPVFRAELTDDAGEHADVDEGNTSEEDCTNKSFDFTGELQRLNESGASDRRSFVEQVENAFKTPAKVDLRYLKDGLLCVDVPPVPSIPLDFSVAMESDSSRESEEYYSGSQIVDVKEPTLFNEMTKATEETKSHFDVVSGSRLLDMTEPTVLKGSDSLASADSEDIVMADSMTALKASTSSSSSKASDGQLNRSFKFGGVPSPESVQKKPMTLSDIIPPPAHQRSLSMSSNFEDESVLRSIYAKINAMPEARPRVDSDSSSKRFLRERNSYARMNAMPEPRPRVDSDTSSKRFMRDHDSYARLNARPRLNSDSSSKMFMRDGRSSFYMDSRRTSAASFVGFESFDEVRRGFEFNDSRPSFYPPPAAPAASTRRANHRQHDSIFSIASVSSYGHVIDSGSADPFDYGLPSLAERPSSENMSIAMSMSVDDTFSFIHRRPRRTRVDSDASSFYFRPPMPQRGHRRQESNMSTNSLAPPISLYNRSFGHRRNDSWTSASSVAMSYAMHGASDGRAAWARHRPESSVDSIMSDFSALNVARPGLGDKMFDAVMPLDPIAASPSESLAAPEFTSQTNRFSYDSIMDDPRSSVQDSLFDRTGFRNSASSESLFGNDDYANAGRRGLLPPGQYRPLSVISINSDHSPAKDGDTMISMLGGGHVRRRSVGSMVNGSPCAQVGKRKQQAYDGYADSPNKARIVEKPSIASSFQFGGDRMIKAQHGLLERQSLEESCLVADGEDISASFRMVPVFSRPQPASRSRSSTCTSNSSASASGVDTPPLSSDGSSISGGSQSSIDLGQLNIMLSNSTHPTSSTRNHARNRARGHGHRRRYSKAHQSRSSVYETIEEESAPTPVKPSSKEASPTQCQSVYIVDSDSVSVHSNLEETTWSNETGITVLRKYYALKDEAHHTVVESKRVWMDTPFSLYALQSFQPPRHPAGMQALLEHSVQNYGPLPSELRPRRMRSRTQSRPSPYPHARLSKLTLSPDRVSKADLQQSLTAAAASPAVQVLQEKPLNANIIADLPHALEALKPFSPFDMDIEPKRENAFGLAPHARPRVGSTARRTALGWSKKSIGGKKSTGTGKNSTSAEQKENVSVGAAAMMTPGESLRISRPRPRGRPTPASTRPKAIRA